MGTIQSVGTLVIGAGYTGMAAGAVAAAKTDQPVVVIEKGAWGGHGNHRDDLQTPSQDSMRGSRLVDQTHALKRCIEKSWQFMEEMRAQTGIDPFLGRGDSYIMVVKDKGHYDRIRDDLTHYGKREGQDFTMMSVEEARARYDIALPGDYAGVVETGQCSTRFNTDTLMDAYKATLERHGGQLRCHTEITDYAERTDGKHYVKLRTSDAGKVTETEYLVDNLVVASGVAVSDTLTQMDTWHNQHYATSPQYYASPAAAGVPERFRPEHNFQVPQRTLYVRLPKEAQKRIHQRHLGAVYMLDIDHKGEDGTKHCIDHLGFYLFTRPEADGSVVVKIGYDPMAHISDHAHTPNHDMFAQTQLEVQKEQMLTHLAKLFNVPKRELAVVKESTCTYPLSTVGSPTCGVSEHFHHVTIFAQQEGYGCMAAAGEYQSLLEGNALPLGERGNPDLPITDAHRHLCALKYGKEKTFLMPPSAEKPYLAASEQTQARRGR
jgi:glycine/D-amino acid oxidase-like deaminating enzyme